MLKFIVLLNVSTPLSDMVIESLYSIALTLNWGWRILASVSSKVKYSIEPESFTK